VNVTASNEFKTLTAVIFDRTKVVFSETFSSTSRNVQAFDFEATSEMIPEATLFVYYIQPSGEIIHDRTVLSFEKRLPNYVRLINSFGFEMESNKNENFCFSSQLTFHSETINQAQKSKLV
jgi:Alpha-2-macroglobulin bait region domain